MDLIQTRKRNKPNLSSIGSEKQQLSIATQTMKKTIEEAEERLTMGSSSSLPGMKRQSFRRQTSNRINHIILGAIILTLICVIFNPMAEQRSEAKKIKDKKVLKSLVKGLIFKNLSTRKNFLPLPVPIPVPIELNEPPVYLKGKPKYVTVYKRTPVVKPTPPVYRMPSVNSPSSYEYMMDPYSLYDSLMLAGSPASYQSLAPLSTSSGRLKDSSSSYRESLGASSTDFNDFDDEYDNYYATNRKGAATKDRRLSEYKNGLAIRRAESNKVRNSVAGGWLLPTDEQESIDHDDNKAHRRLKRQAYESSYENEPPCYGFPLEVNVKSRIKMDRVFPIHGNSQFKKCIKVGRPLLPPVEDKPPYIHIFTLNKPY